MQIRHIFLSGIAISILTACATQITPEQKAEFEESASRKIACSEGHDCVDKWHQAIKWIRNNSKTNIKTMSGNLIATNITSGEGSWSYSVTRTEESKRHYVINFTPSCDYMFGCNPSELAVRASFADALLGTFVPKTSTTVHTYGSIRQLEPQIKAVVDKCEAERKSGELQNYRASAECASPHIRRIFVSASYPYMDIAREFITKRMKLAKQVDDKQMTADDMESKTRVEIASIEKREVQRNVTPPPATTGKTAASAASSPPSQPVVSALPVPVIASVGTPSASLVRK